MNDYDLQQQQIQRRRDMLNALGSQQLGSGQMVGRVYVPPSPLEAIAKLAGAWMAGKGSKNLDSESQQIENKRREALGQELEGFDSNPDQMAAARKALVSAHPEMQQLGSMVYRRKNEKPAEQWKVMTAEEKQKLGLPAEDAYQYNTVTNETKKLDNATKVTTTVNTPGLESKFKQQFGEDRAKEYTDLRERAATAENTLAIANQMKELEAGGIFSGPTANLATTLTAFAQAAGVPLDQETTAKMANSTAMQQQVATKIAAVLLDGSVGRSMTDADREAFERSLPSMLTSPEGRAQVIAMMETNAQADQQAFGQMQDAIIKQYPEMAPFVKIPVRPGQRTIPAAQSGKSGPIIKNW